MNAAWTTKRIWQGAVILLLTVMISLNLRILMNVTQSDVDENMRGEPLRSGGDCKTLLKYVGKARVDTLNMSEEILQWTNYKPSQARILGHHRANKGFLTVGVPSIKRVNGMTYLRKTLDSLVATTTPRDKMDVVILVFLADFDTAYNKGVLDSLVNHFMEYINMGFIQIVQASRDFYPSLTKLKRNFNDKADRVQWRAKQVSDFAFMFLHSRNISTYYLQLEDDVVCADGFVSAIRDYIRKRRKSWAVLDFSELGFIGKLFKARDLTKLAHYMLTFYDEQPVDWLIRYFRMSMTQHKVILRKPTLFQHIGATSSFDTTKQNKLKDRFFDSGQKKWKSDNPEGTIYTTIKTYGDNTADLAYSLGSGCFWGISPLLGQEWTIVFDRPEDITRVIVETSSNKHKDDKLQHAVLETSSDRIKVHLNGTQKCKNFVEQGVFTDGRVEVGKNETILGSHSIRCVRIRVTRNQTEWAVIDQVAIFVKKAKLSTEV